MLFFQKYFIKYLGITIDYVDGTEEEVLDERFNTKHGDVREILTNKDGHFLVLENEIRVKIEYTVSQSGDPRFVNQMNGTDAQSLHLQVLQAYEFMNKSIAGIGNDKSTDMSSSILSNTQASSTSTTFASSEDIIYTDLRDGRKKKSGAVANLDGVFLTDGSPVVFKFVREKE